VHGDDRVQTGPAASAHDHVLVVERFDVAVRGRIGPWVAGSIRCRSVHGAGGGDQLATVDVVEPVPVVVVCELPVPALDVDDPSVVVEPGCVVELEALGDWLVPGVVEVVVDCPVGVDAAAAPSPGASSLVPAPLGVAPPPLNIVEVPPVACDFIFVGTVTVVVETVTVVGAAADGLVAVDVF